MTPQLEEFIRTIGGDERTSLELIAFDEQNMKQLNEDHETILESANEFHDAFHTQHPDENCKGTTYYIFKAFKALVLSGQERMTDIYVTQLLSVVCLQVGIDQGEARGMEINPLEQLIGSILKDIKSTQDMQE